MDLSVNHDQLMTVFGAYNLAIWPMQILAYLAALLAIYSASKQTRFSNNITSGVLSFFWLWTGIAFCLLHWAPLYPTAYAFVVLMIVQGLLFLWDSVKPTLSFHAGNNTRTMIGLGFAAYAMIGYPVAGYFLGHIYPRSLPFGLVPCPTTVFTLGLLMLTDKPIQKRMLVIPIVIAASAFVPVAAGIFEDIGLLIAGLVCGLMLIRSDSRKPEPQPHE
jgi:hypothetical protein